MATKQNEILNDPNYIPLGEHGFVGLVDVMGDDSTPPARARMSYGKGTKSVNDDRNLLRYLIRHKHTTPIEMVELVFHMKMPIFVMRQHVRHRMATINEYSGRYSEMSDEFYVPLFEDIALQSKTNKQGRIEGDFISEEDKIEFDTKLQVQELMSKSYSQTYETYKEMLELGVARELARLPLSVANMTECFWKIDLHNFFHYSKLRRDAHAQKEIRDQADALFALVERKLPLCCEAFNDYIFQAVTFSRMEWNLLRDKVEAKELAGILSYYDEDGKEFTMKKYGLSKREWDEFITKLKK
jgi:thymidylate synthase (FAD)